VIDFLQKETSWTGRLKGLAIDVKNSEFVSVVGTAGYGRRELLAATETNV